MGLGPVDLLFDCYSAHRTDAVKEAAARLGIARHFIPAGLTDEFQRLDRPSLEFSKLRRKGCFMPDSI
jgi:hypothetical protein